MKKENILKDIIVNPKTTLKESLKSKAAKGKVRDIKPPAKMTRKTEIKAIKQPKRLTTIKKEDVIEPVQNYQPVRSKKYGKLKTAAAIFLLISNAVSLAFSATVVYIVRKALVEKSDVEQTASAKKYNVTEIPKGGTRNIQNT